VSKNGILDKRLTQDDTHAEVEIVSQDVTFACIPGNAKLICVSGGYGDIENSRIYLDSEQFLSLLTWGE
jgi:hypothetical protein